MSTTLTNHLDREMGLTGPEMIVLPLYHNCDFDEFIGYLQNWKIETNVTCNVFDKKIIYTFYGASKFVSNNVLGSATQGLQTACIILDPNFCREAIYQIYPFDTGAVSGSNQDIRRPLLRWDQIKTKLNLGNRIDRVNKMILMCYKSIEDYLACHIEVEGDKVIGKYRAPKTIGPLTAVQEIMLDKNIADDRRLCYEVQFENELDLDPQVLAGFIVSNEFLKDPDFIELVKKYRFPIEKGKFYSESLANNYEIGKVIKSKSIEFTNEWMANTN